MKKILKSFIKKDSGSISILVIASILFVLIILLNLFLWAGNTTTSQNKEIELVQEEYNVTDDEMTEAYINTINTTKATKTINETNENETNDNKTNENETNENETNETNAINEIDATNGIKATNELQ